VTVSWSCRCCKRHHQRQHQKQQPKEVEKSVAESQALTPAIRKDTRTPRKSSPGAESKSPRTEDDSVSNQFISSAELRISAIAAMPAAIPTTGISLSHHQPHPAHDFIHKFIIRLDSFTKLNLFICSFSIII